MTKELNLINNPLPEYLDPGSLGGWVKVSQKQMHRDNLAGRLPGKPPLATSGIHETEWLNYVKGLQGIWGIDMDGGMGPDFRATYKEQTGKTFLSGDRFPNAPTLALGPKSKHIAQWFYCAQTLGGLNHNFSLLTFGSRERRYGGSSEDYLTSKGSTALEKVVEGAVSQDAQIILVDNGSTRDAAFDEWRSAWSYQKPGGPPLQVLLRDWELFPSLKHWEALSGVTVRPLVIILSEEARKKLG